MNSPYQIITECALFFNVSTEDIISSSRKGYSVTDARAVACYIINRKMGKSSTETGRLFHRNHSTVLAAVKKCERWLSFPKSNPAAVQAINYIEDKYFN